MKQSTSETTASNVKNIQLSCLLTPTATVDEQPPRGAGTARPPGIATRRGTPPHSDESGPPARPCELEAPSGGDRRGLPMGPGGPNNLEPDL